MDKVIVLTGASSGLGASLVRQLLASGAKVTGIDTQPATTSHENYLHIQGDIASSGVRAQAVQAAMAAFGNIDILINNAAVGIYASSYESSDAENARVYEVNVLAPLGMIALVVPHFIRRQSGMIVNIGSICGKVTVPWATVYCSTKFALAGISQGLRRELAPHRVHVLHVMPAVIDTAFRRHVLRGQAPGKVQTMRRSSDPDCTAKAILSAIARKKKNLYTPFTLAYPFTKMQEYTPWLMDWYLKSKQ